MPVLAPCRGCGAAIDCQRGLNNPDASDYAYNLTADPILPILINCPQGFSCLPGPGETTQIFLNCCGHLLSTTISGEMTPAQIVAQFEEMLDRCNTTFAAECNRTPGQDGGGGDGGGGGGGGGNGPDPPNRLTFCANTPQTALAHCQFGGVFSYTTVAGKFVAVDTGSGGNCQATVNAAALAYAQNQANTLMNKNCVAPQPGDPFNGWLCLGESIDVPDDYYAVPVPSQPYAWGLLAGSLPPGITLDPTGPPTFPTATLNGTPTTAGFYSWIISANGLINFWEHIYINDSLAVFGVTNPTLPDATAGIAYSQQILTAGGTAPVTFEEGVPALPAWATLDTDGTVHGTPALGDVATSTFQVKFTDADHGTCTQTITIQVKASCPNWSTLFWGPDLGGTVGGGIENSSPTNAAGATFHLDASIAGILDAAGGQIRATIPYNGPGCNCNLHFSWTENQPHGGAVNVWGISVDVRYGPCPNPAGYRNATDAFGCTTVLFLFTAPTSANPQTIDLPFTIPDTGGSTMYIFLDALIGINGATAGLYTVSMDGTFSNV